MRGKVKPSKPVALGQMIGGVVFVIIGLTVVIPKMSQADGPFFWFGLLWTMAALGGAVFGAVNLFSEEGIPTEEFTCSANQGNEMTPKTAESRLEEIGALREKGLISEKEYEAKRLEIVDQI